MIYENGERIRAYKGDHSPINIYQGTDKVDGFHDETQVGTSASFSNTYNDEAGVVVKGNTVQVSDWYAKDGLSSQAGTPTPDAPISITSNLPAGTYKYTSTDGIYEFTLTEELRGLTGAVDKIVFDRVSHSGMVERRNTKIVVDGTETIIKVDGDTTFTGFRINNNFPCALNQNGQLCSHFKFGGGTTPDIFVFQMGSSNLWINTSISIATDVSTFINWLQTQVNANNPVTVVYQLATPTKTALAFTKVASSTATEVPMTFLTSTPSLDYPAQVYDVSGNVLVNGEIKVHLPALRKIGTVSDSHVMRTGAKTKRISDWLTLDGKPYLAFSLMFLNYKRVDIVHPGPFHVLQPQQFLMYDNTSQPVPYGNSAVRNSAQIHGTLGDRVTMWIGNELTGFGDMILPTVAEWKAYFYGWKMCNADGTSPYYKSEVPYTPSTWAEWGSKNNVTIVGNSIVADNNITAGSFAMLTNIKPSTKYGFLASITVNTRSTYTLLSAVNLDGRAFAGGTAFSVASGFVGKSKNISISASAITNNAVRAFIPVDTGRIEISEYHIYELPAGSQIESDFNTMTADQLAAKYTFNGLCVKNWKHLVGNQADIDASKTATLPTASYDGYTPYKMIYQLAAPIEEQYTADPLPTYYPTTVIETDCVNAVPTIEATVKVEDA